MNKTLLLAFIALETIESTGSYKFRWDINSGSKASDSSGYQVKADSPQVEAIIPFSFTISDLSIDFGTLTPGSFPNPLPTTTLAVSPGGASGYSVTAFEDHPLTLQNGSATIPDTVCNTNACSETTAGAWTDISKYGFGYNLSGNDIPAGFINSNYFKQFSNAALSEPPQIIMSSNRAGANPITTVTYKANVSTTQTAGDYENTIVFIAAPTY